MAEETFPPYAAAPVTDEAALLALRGLVEAYRFTCDDCGVAKRADETPGAWLGRIAEHEKQLANVGASTLRAIHALCPEVVDELRNIGSISPSTDVGRAMYRIRWVRVFKRLGIDRHRQDSEFDVLPERDEIRYEGTKPIEIDYAEHGRYNQYLRGGVNATP